MSSQKFRIGHTTISVHFVKNSEQGLNNSKFKTRVRSTSPRLVASFFPRSAFIAPLVTRIRQHPQLQQSKVPKLLQINNRDGCRLNFYENRATQGINYHTWKIRIQHVLTLKGLKRYIIEDPTTDRGELDTWTEKDAKIQAIIGLTLSVELFGNVREVTTAKEMWNSIKNVF